MRRVTCERREGGSVARHERWGRGGDEARDDEDDVQLDDELDEGERANHDK